MTAEIAVMNTQAVALAADSAVTINGEEGPKIFASANKIFALSKHEPVGIMIYGSAGLVGMPWESVVKEYRESLGRTRFAHVSEQADHFLEWIGRTPMLDAEMKRSYVASSVYQWFDFIRQGIADRVYALIDDGAEPARPEVRLATRQTITEVRRFVRDAPARPGADDFSSLLHDEYGDLIPGLIDAAFELLPLTTAQRRAFHELAFAPIERQLRRGASGIVIAGFGTDDWMPRLREFHVDGVALDRPIFTPGRTADISTDMHNSALVSGFAQSDMISTFMEGVAPEYQRFIDSYLGTIIERFEAVLSDAADGNSSLRERLGAAKDELADEFATELYLERSRAYIEPVMDVVRNLPKDELAGLAESLVNLTSLKRRISRDDETVGGPVDVAVISKGDGLIWIRRKHYFDPSLNQHFFANYYGKDADANQDIT